MIDDHDLIVRSDAPRAAMSIVIDWTIQIAPRHLHTYTNPKNQFLIRKIDF